jgi:ribonuclease Z
MKIVFLGTSAGIPTKTRNHTSILLIYNGQHILFDCGEGVQRQLRKIDVSPLKIEKIFLTHLHADHILGLPGILQTLAMNKYNKTLYIFGPRGLKKYINLISSFFPIVKEIKIEVKEIVKDNEQFDFDKFLIKAVKLKHIVNVYGYLVMEKDKVKIKDEYVKLIGPSPIFKKLKEGKAVKYGDKIIKPEEATYRIKGKRVAIILDTSRNKNIFSLAKDVDLLIIECVYDSSLKELAKDYHHLTTLDVIDIVKKCNPKKTIITHISERYEKKEKILLDELKELKNVDIAYDFMEINL